MRLKKVFNKRCFASAFVMLAGGLLLFLGMTRHEQEVVTLTEKQVEPPSPFEGGGPPMPPDMGPPGPDSGFGPGTPPPPPPMEKETIVIEDSEIEPEAVLVKEVTFGGLKRNEEGKLERTYSGKPPSFCPT